MGTLYAVRHGRTPGNDDHLIQGSTNVNLNEKGIMQATELFEKVNKLNIDVCISSTLNRAYQTAKIIYPYSEIITMNCFEERHFGSYENLKTSDVDFKSWWDYNSNIKFCENGESIKEFVDRIFKGLDFIKENYRDKNILLVTHGGVLCAIDCYFNGITNDLSNVLFNTKNCSISEYKL